MTWRARWRKPATATKPSAPWRSLTRLPTTEIDPRIWLDIGRFARDLGAPDVAARFVERGGGGRQ